MSYTKTAWVNDSSPDIDATNLNHIEDGIGDAHNDLVSHEADLGNPHVVTKAQIGLGSVEDGAEINNISDANATDLTDAGESILHYHNSDRARANHTGTQVASTISDFDTEVSNNSSVVANTANIASNASNLSTHESAPLAHIEVLTKTGDYTITTSDFNRSIRMNSVADHVFTLPSVGSESDGGRVTLIKQGSGKLTVQASDSDIISDSSAGGTIYDEEAVETYATLVLEYMHGNTTWVIISGLGIWSTT